jgi:hypothetical protein
MAWNNVETATGRVNLELNEKKTNDNITTKRQRLEMSIQRLSLGRERGQLCFSIPRQL